MWEYILKEKYRYYPEKTKLSFDGIFMENLFYLFMKKLENGSGVCLVQKFFP